MYVGIFTSTLKRTHFCTRACVANKLKKETHASAQAAVELEHYRLGEELFQQGYGQVKQCRILRLMPVSSPPTILPVWPTHTHTTRGND